MAWTKVDLINELALIRGYRSYLEICTPTSGMLYGAIDRTRYSECRRLMYRYPASVMAKLIYRARFRDTLPVDFRTTDLDIAECVQAIQARGLKYDVVLVDPFHEYTQSIRDIGVAVDLLNARGTVIVHDCFPRDGALAGPTFVEGAWCGVTYKAYLDFVLSRDDLDFCTVDVDFGCGVIRRRDDTGSLPGRVGGDTAADKAKIVERWTRLGDDYDAAFTLLTAHAGTLLNLVTVEEFLAAERARA
ncbi:MAG TPA: hypothetical protein VFW22_01815 [Pseudolabrys sp.]|nr:hypothetical protein [Pseudolabrys sp.]